ncbi:MAG TPA: methylamine utilization protein [Caldimonas sp.]
MGLAGADARAATFTAQVTDRAGAPVRDAVVYLLGAGAAKPPASGPPTVVSQQDRDFIPFVTAIQTGTAVTFPNRDQLMHHVYSFSPAKTFQIKLYEGDPPHPIVFDKPGLVALGCNIHDWMQAYILVVDTPHFAVSDAHGQARIEGVPSGSYEARAWHPHAPAGEWRGSVSAAEGGRAATPIVLALVPPRRKPKPPLDTTKY